jgi:regulator of nonsense transcripts 2
LEYINEVEVKNAEREVTRKNNMQVVRPEESYFSKLDSNLKKNTACVRKIVLKPDINDLF